VKLFNSLSTKKEEFTTFTPKVVNMYVCGPTVYDYLHVGNFRGAIFFNFLARYLRHVGYTVNFAYNFTDVDDKIIKKSLELNKPALEVSEFFINEFLQDFKSLKLDTHTYNPKVSEYIPQMIRYVEEIIQKNMAYVDTDGSVYLRRSKLPNPGVLSGRDINEGLTGDKNHDHQKEHEADFALWKGAKPGEISWPSPWGEGRPGWHLECSVMIHELFQGQTLDIHGGGLDLLFPHHENELNQCLAHGEPSLAKFWVHNQMLNLGDAKMSKSIGNVQTGRDFIQKHSGEVLKYIILSHHYRSIIDFSEKNILQNTRDLHKFYQTLHRAERANSSNQATNLFDQLKDKALTALADDLNTPLLFSYLHEAVNEFNKSPKTKAASLMQLFTKDLGGILGLFQEPIEEYNDYLNQKALIRLGVTILEIEKVIHDRNNFRQMKNYSESDRLRQELVARGINLLDSPTGTTWEII
jgi:cysteinyl-tRNA synthetase